MSLPEHLEIYPEMVAAYNHAIENAEANTVPSPQELREEWLSIYDHSAKTVDAGEVYGALRKPTPGEKIWGVASIDLCEVTRETCEAFMQLGGFTVAAAGRDYGYGRPFGIHEQPEVVTRIVQSIMIKDSIKPVAGIEDITAVLQEARSNGIYVVANTSTLPGCELPTLRWLKRYMPDAFDGIVLPRNHDGSGSTTKGTAKQAAIDRLTELSQDSEVHFTLHIDDAPHHIRAVRDTAKSMGLANHADFTPRYVWNEDHDDLNHFDTPKECFEAAQEAMEEARRTV